MCLICKNFPFPQGNTGRIDSLPRPCIGQSECNGKFLLQKKYKHFFEEGGGGCKVSRRFIKKNVLETSKSSVLKSLYRWFYGRMLAYVA